MNELIFKIIPLTAPKVDIGFRPPIISGIAEITNKYCIDFFYWNGQSYTSEIEYINTDNKYYNDTAYHIDDMIELELFSLISDDVAGAGSGEIIKKYDDYEICIAPASDISDDVAGAVDGGDEK